jgi:hypothetical protein
MYEVEQAVYVESVSSSTGTNMGVNTVKADCMQVALNQA